MREDPAGSWEICPSYSMDWDRVAFVLCKFILHRDSCRPVLLTAALAAENQPLLSGPRA